eukprot:scaffold377_cov269-Pinguiococcus_pyrenoidosus.AAC.9
MKRRNGEKLVTTSDSPSVGNLRTDPGNDVLHALRNDTHYFVLLSHLIVAYQANEHLVELLLVFVAESLLVHERHGAFPDTHGAEERRLAHATHRSHPGNLERKRRSGIRDLWSLQTKSANVTSLVLAYLSNRSFHRAKVYIGGHVALSWAFQPRNLPVVGKASKTFAGKPFAAIIYENCGSAGLCNALGDVLREFQRGRTNLHHQAGPELGLGNVQDRGQAFGRMLSSDNSELIFVRPRHPIRRRLGRFGQPARSLYH